MANATATFDPERVFLFTDGKQIGPLRAEAAEALWIRKGSPTDCFIWSPGMKDWESASAFFISQSTATDAPDATHVFAVDDDPVMLEIIKLTLQNNGYHVTTAPDVVPACRALEANGLGRFACVVTDYNMPGGSGIDLVRWIKQRDESLQVLILTAKDDKQLVKEGLRAGIFDFLEKPLISGTFIRSLRGAIERTQQRREERTAFLEMVKLKLSGQGRLAEEVITKLAARESQTGSIMRKLDTIIEYSKGIEHGSVSGSGHMHGELGTLGMLDLVQLLVQAHKTGCLRIFVHASGPGADQTTALWLRNGHMYHAECEGFTGIEALRRILPRTQGVFEFSFDQATLQRSIEGDPMSLVLMISAEMDQQQIA